MQEQQADLQRRLKEAKKVSVQLVGAAGSVEKRSVPSLCFFLCCARGLRPRNGRCEPMQLPGLSAAAPQLWFNAALPEASLGCTEAVVGAVCVGWGMLGCAGGRSCSRGGRRGCQCV